MDAWSGAIGLPLIGAALHPLLGAMVQRATRQGIRLPVVLGVANLITLAVFGIYLKPDFSEGFHPVDALAVFNGILYFWGQWFSVQSVRKGDLVVHSSALGFKVLIVAILSAGVGLEKAGAGLIGGAVLAAIAVYLVAGATAERWKENRLTVWLTLVACLIFGTNDFLTGWKSNEIGAARWLILMMATAGVLSIGMLHPRWKDVRDVFGNSVSAWPVAGAGIAMGLQALVVNIAFSKFGEPALSNIAYSTRGVMAVFFVWGIWVLKGQGKGGLSGRQLLGAAMMVAALAMVLI
ncbi:hypothetical protein ACFSSA_05935 [Luteolibacter algae]|uniref:EamA domain-containing protein n=1 Tax=Luteolibacter algae TaxID=454151 RepID=A0ABW5D9B4_9BACT